MIHVPFLLHGHLLGHSVRLKHVELPGARTMAEVTRENVVNMLSSRWRMAGRDAGVERDNQERSRLK